MDPYSWVIFTYHIYFKKKKKCEVARVDMLLFLFSVNLISLLGEYEGQVTEPNTTQVSLELSCKATTTRDFITVTILLNTGAVISATLM